MTKIYIFLISSLYSLSIFSLNPCPDNPEDKWHNCFGSYQYPSGETYSGEWKNNLFDGDGVFLYQNGDRYVGQFKKDLPEGKGTYQYKNGDLYVGAWKNGKRQSKGFYEQVFARHSRRSGLVGHSNEIDCH